MCKFRCKFCFPKILPVEKNDKLEVWFTPFFEDKFCTSKSHYTANIFPTTILIKEEELDSPTLVVNVNHFWGKVDHLVTIHHPQAFSPLLCDFFHRHDAFLLLNSTSLMISLGKMMPTLLLFATSALFNRSRKGMLWFKISSARTRGVLALPLIQITHLLLCFAAVQTVVCSTFLNCSEEICVKMFSFWS